MLPDDGGSIPVELLERLLNPPASDQELALLRTAGLLDTAGLGRLLDVAEELVRSDPSKAGRLSEVCARGAEACKLPAIAARSSYIRLQTHFSKGEFDAALRMAGEAYRGYMACGRNLDAVRTHVGRMSVLLELGLYREALEAGQGVLDTLDGQGEIEVSPTPREGDMLRALVQQNLGGCFEYMGLYEKALEAYRIAEERYRALGEIERVGEILDNRGSILVNLGRGNEAIEAHEAAAEVFTGAGLKLPYAKALVNIGETHQQLANYRSSLAAFERARHLYDDLDELTDKILLLLDTANVYLDLNLYPEALAAYQKVDPLLESAGMVHNHARALRGMGVAFTAMSDLEEAEETLARSASLFAAAGNSPLLSGVRLDQSLVHEKLGAWDTSLVLAQQALDLVVGNDWSAQRFYAHLRLVDLLLPNVSMAEPHLMEARLLAERLALPQLRHRLNERVGRVRRLQGNDEEALVVLEEAIDEIERMRGTLAHESMRASFLLDKIGAYEELLKLYLARWAESDPSSVLAVAERAKSRALIDLLTGIAREPARSAEGSLQERIGSLQADLNATYNQMLGTSEVAPDTPLPNLHLRAVELESEISELRLRVEPAASDPFTPTEVPENWRNLPSDITLLAYHIVNDEIVAFVSGQGRVRIARNCGSVRVLARLLQRLEVQWDRMGAGREFVDRHAEYLALLTRQVLASLYDELVAPIEPLLAASSSSERTDGARKIAIVPHGLLHQVPFHALFDGEAYLLDRFEVSYAPSATVFSLCQQQISRSSERALVLGVTDPLIPHVATEVRASASHLPGAEVLTDRQATTGAIREKAAGCDVLHLACHGMFRVDNPMFSALKLHDGWLTAADILSLDLGGALVTLSACESARNRVLAGDEILGLARGFLGAGAATLVASLWLVQDETTSQMMEGWYAGLSDGAGRAAALRDAQLALKERHPHPFYWAPFVLIGQR